MNLSHLNQSFSKIIDEIPHSKQEVCFSSVAGGSSSFFISLIHQRVNSPLLVVVDSFESGEKLLHDIEFFRGKGKVDFFPHWDIMPYDNLSPDKSVIANRLATLSNLLLKKSNIVITTPNALIQKIMPVSAFLNYTFTLKIGEVYPREELIRKLCNIGYIRVDTVEEIGEFSIRGEIVDIFPLGKVQPIRLDFFDDDLETMRFFEVDSQRSKLEVDNVLVLPSHEIIFDEQSVQLAVKQVAQKKGTLSRQLFEVYEEQIQTGVPFPGVENFIPLYFKECSTLFDYFQDNPLIIFEDREQVRLRSNDYFHEIASEYELSKQQDNLTLDVSELYLDPTQLQAQFSKYKTVNFQTQGIEDTAVTTILPVLSNEGLHSISISSENKNQNPIKNVINQLIQWHKEGALVAIAARNQSEAEKVRHMMMELDYSAEIEKEVSYEDRTRFLLGTSHKKQENIIIFEDFISSGFRFVNEVGESKVIFVSDEEIFGPRRKQRRVKRSSLKQFLSSLGSLNVGDYVVHVEYGIGQYEGLKKIEIQDTSTDYLVLSYLGGDKVYVPVEKFHLVQKFSGLDTKRPRLNKLGEKTWKKTKSKVRTEIMDMADDLVKIYAQRSAQQGVSFSKDSTMMDEFALTFPYQETDDQEQAIHEVISDMESTNPMDRLVCGDVGFGKTEVAMRAACKAAIDSYQVGILVPTTILAQQH
ncbi:MAG: transcription-repair coupling factor (superfamily II helicase), partial [bacterium]